MTACDDGSAGGTEAEDAIGAIRARGEAVRVEQLDRALSALDDERLSDAQRAAVERLSERIVDRLLSVPHGGLRRLAATGDDAAVERALGLFGSD